MDVEGGEEDGEEGEQGSSETMKSKPKISKELGRGWKCMLIARAAASKVWAVMAEICEKTSCFQDWDCLPFLTFTFVRDGWAGMVVRTFRVSSRHGIYTLGYTMKGKPITQYGKSPHEA